MTAPITGEGTSEERWRPWLAEQQWPAVEAAALLRGRRLVVLAAHPDDETLGVGGLLAAGAASAERVRLLWASDGEASHPGSRAVTPGQLRERRRAESARALRTLGVLGYEARLLGLPDSALTAYEEQVTEAVRTAMEPGDLLLAPWRRDGHPDHDACGRAAAAAAGAVGAILLEYPIWAWHWARPGDPDVPWGRARVVPLHPDEQRAKRASLEAFTSQREPLGDAPADAAVLPPHVIAHFERTFEVLFE